MYLFSILGPLTPGGPSVRAHLATAWKGGAPVGEGVCLDDIQIECGGSEQEIAAVRATGIKMVPRGNKFTTATFSVLRSFASVLSAANFWRTHQAETPQGGRLDISTSEGGVAALIAIPDCTLRMRFAPALGKSLVITYFVRGGPLE
jgi:hypothetical protein